MIFMWLPTLYFCEKHLHVFVTRNIYIHTRISLYYIFMFYVLNYVNFSTVRIERLEFDPDNQVIRGERSDDESD